MRQTLSSHVLAPIRFLNFSTSQTDVISTVICTKSRGDQILNANLFKRQGYAEILQEEELTKETFKNRFIC